MKKLISLSLVLLMLISMAACGNVPDGSAESAVSDSGSAAQEQPDVQPEQEREEQPEPDPEPEPDPDTELYFAEDYEEIYNELLSRQAAAEEYSARGDMNYGTSDLDADNMIVEEPTEEPESGKSDYSETNVQVSGIDEGDIVKTDGDYIYILRNVLTDESELLIIKADGASSSLVSRTELNHFKASGTSRQNTLGRSIFERSAREIFIFGTTLAVVYECRTYSEMTQYDIWNYASQSRTIVELYDVSDPEKPFRAGLLGQDGEILGTRLYEGRLYIISNWNDYRSYRAGIKITEDCIPALYSGEDRELIPAEDICICPHNSSTNFIVAAVYDLAKAEVLDVQTVLGGGSEVYMSSDNIYIFGRAWYDGASEPQQDGLYYVRDYTLGTKTSVFRFAVTGDGLSLEAQCLVPGYMESRFSADEYNGYLRMVTTVNRSSYSVYTNEENDVANYRRRENDTETNALYVLDDALNIVGSVENLASGERVYSARFDGYMAYFCTFEKVDPLFAVDCSNPEKPVVLSALKISGFSEYLHRWGENQLFGFGYEADESTGWMEGLKMVMFNTANKADVSVENSLHLQNIKFSEALYEPHAFFISPEKNIIGFVGDGDYYIYGYSTEEGFYERAHFSFNGSDYNARGLYIGDKIYIIGRDGGYVLDLESCEMIKELYW